MKTFTSFIAEAGKIGPHEGRVVQMMQMGTKPAAWIYPGDVEWTPLNTLVKQGKLSKGWVGDFGPNQSYAFVQKGQEHRIPAMKKEIELVRKAEKEEEAGRDPGGDKAYAQLRIFHKKMGELLGYSKEDIALFLSRQ